MQTMDIYERDAYLLSLSNLAMLKVFHDHGADTDQISLKSFAVYYPESIEPCYDIFSWGLQQLFEESNFIPYEELEEYDEVFEDGIINDEVFLISDKRLKTVLESKHRKELLYEIQKANDFTYCEADIAVTKSNDLMAQIYFGYMFHELGAAFCQIKVKLDELVNRLEEEKINGISDQVDRQAS